MLWCNMIYISYNICSWYFSDKYIKHRCSVRYKRRRRKRERFYCVNIQRFFLNIRQTQHPRKRRGKKEALRLLTKRINLDWNWQLTPPQHLTFTHARRNFKVQYKIYSLLWFRNTQISFRQLHFGGGNEIKLTKKNTRKWNEIKKERKKFYYYIFSHSYKKFFVVWKMKHKTQKYKKKYGFHSISENIILTGLIYNKHFFSESEREKFNASHHIITKVFMNEQSADAMRAIF